MKSTALLRHGCVFVCLAILLGLLTGCGGSNNTTTAGPGAVTLVTVTPPSAVVPIGVNQQFTATAHKTDGTTQDVTTQATWAASPSSVATITSDGVLQGVTPGSVTVTATFSSVSGNTSATVTAAQVKTLDVSPNPLMLDLSQSTQMHAIASFTDGTMKDITAQVTWNSTNSNVIFVSATGLATAVGAGSASVTATFGNITSGSPGARTDSADREVPARMRSASSVTVNPPTSVVITGNANIPAGGTSQLTATGTFADGQVLDITDFMNWSSNSPNVTISPTGLVTTSGPTGGSVTITASTPGGGSSSSGTLPFTVAPAALVSVVVTPNPATVPLGATVQFVATGTFTDHSISVLTSGVMWGSTDGTTLSIDANSGLATAMKVGGPVTISATTTLPAVNVQATVTNAAIKAIAVTPPNGAQPLGLTQQFTATATLTDNTTTDVTSAVMWTSSNNLKVTINNAGLASTLGVTAPGTVTITAKDAGTGVSGQTLFTVNIAALTTIAITPNGAVTLKSGQTQAYMATGTYTDNTTKDITNSVTWSLNELNVDNIVASISATGVATASLTAGGANVVATDPSTHIGGSNSPLLTTIALTILEVDPNPTLTIASGDTQAFTALATYSDDSTTDFTNLVTWNSSNSGAATIDKTGLATGTIAGGSTTISATDPITGFASTNTTALSVKSISSLEVVPASASVTLVNNRPTATLPQIGPPVPFTALAHFSNGDVSDYTSKVTWQSNNPSAVFVDPSTGIGTVNGFSGAFATVTATTSPASGSVQGFVDVNILQLVSRFAYVLNNDSTVSTFVLDSDKPGSVRANGYTMLGAPPTTGVMVQYPVNGAPNTAFIYAMEQSSNQVETISIETNSGTVTAPGTITPVAGFPVGIAVDGGGNFLYVLDSNFLLDIFSITPGTGALTEVTGGPFSITGSSLTALAVAPNGKFIYAADTNNDIYAESFINGNFTEVDEVPGGFSVQALAVDPSGRYLYAADTETGNILEYSINQATGDLTAISTISFSDTGGTPASIAFDVTGNNLFVLGGTTVNEYFINTDGSLGNINSFDIGLSMTSMVVDPSNTFAYVLQEELDGINVYRNFGGSLSLDHAVGSKMLPNTISILRSSQPATFEPHYAFVANKTSSDISAYAAGFGLFSLGGATPTDTGPEGIAITSDERFVYTVHPGSFGVAGFDNLGFLQPMVGSPFQNITGTGARALAIDPSNRFMYVANAGSQSVTGLVINTSDGTLLLNDSNPFNTAVGLPYDLAIDPAGSFLVTADGASNMVESAGIDALSGNLFFGDFAPTSGTTARAVTFHPTGEFFYVVSDGPLGSPGVLDAFQINGLGTLTALGGGPVPTGISPVGVAADPTGQYVFVVNQGDPSVTTYQVQPDGSLFQISVTAATGLNQPTAIAVDATGSFVYVTNAATNDIAEYQNFNGFLSAVTPNVPAGTAPTAIKTTYFIN